jgi:hypothetical protein
MRWALTVWLLAFAPGGHAGEVYRWLDSRGSAHYSDQPPARPDVTLVPVPTCNDDACRERRERAYRDAVELYERMQARELRTGKRQGRRGASSRTLPKRVAPGMTRRDVVKTLGRPTIVKRRPGMVHGGELWIYRDGSSTRKVRFNRDGVVTRIDD